MNGVNMSDSPPQSGGFCRNIEAPHRPICSCFWILSCAIAATALFNCLILALSSYTTLPSIVWPLTAGINLILALMLVLKLYIETKRQLESTALSRKQTIDAENNQDRFLETITHELRTPLSSIIGSSEILNTTNTNQLDYDTHINTITNNCQHLLGLVDGLLDVTKIKSGKLEPSLSCTSITDVINEAINISRPIANIKKIQLNTAIKTDTTNWIITDPLRLRQILVNLLGNAIRHTDKGSVTIVFNEEITHTTGMISISIADTGCGIAPDEISRIFEPHFQSGSAKNIGSAGLGLSICGELATLLGGSISATSTLGQGSAFTLRIPKHRSFVFDPNSINQKKSTNTNKSLAGTTILVAEDSRDIQTLITHILTSAGATVTLVNTGQQFVDEMRSGSNTPDIALVDINLDGLDGITATHMIRDGGITLPILALTASTAAMHRDACLVAGFDDYLTKPIQAKTLVRACAKWTNQTQAA
ncbi:MAG: hypothetical protein COB69_06935 [Phycisphaera sp.]|nr:MAG: hypothetical protein COB69_06935 [Phycisphaera sp.]